MKMQFEANRFRESTCWRNALKTTNVIARFAGRASSGNLVTADAVASGVKRFTMILPNDGGTKLNSLWTTGFES